MAQLCRNAKKKQSFDERMARTLINLFYINCNVKHFQSRIQMENIKI